MKASGNKWLCTLSRQVDHAPASILQDQRDAPMATGELDVFANNLHDTVSAKRRQNDLRAKRRVGLTFEADTGGEDLYLRIASVEPEGQVAMVFEY